MNKPVAWMHENPDYSISKNWSQEYNIPLYTHPVKELTDEEIIDLCVKELEKLIAPVEPDYDPWQWNDTIERAILKVQSVKAILRKAQEK